MPTQVLDGLYQLILPTPFPVGPVNCYLSTHRPITLVDTGTRWEATRQSLVAQLNCLGLGPEAIERVVITHAHADHFGLAADIVRLSGAAVITHPYNRLLLNPTDESRRARDHFYQQLLSSAGVPKEEQQSFFQSRGEARTYSEPVRADEFVDEGDQLELAGLQWRVLHTPGHAGGLICLFEDQSRTLLSNDHLLRSISSNPIVEPDEHGGPRPHRLVQYLHHLQRMADLEPSVAWTGHGPEITDVAKTVRQREKFHQRRANYLLDMLRHREMSAHELATELLGRRAGFDAFLALSETIGHLDWLSEQGKIAAVPTATPYWHLRNQSSTPGNGCPDHRSS